MTDQPSSSASASTPKPKRKRRIRRRSSSSITSAAPDEFVNRELSWLEFNRRVLHEAIDERNPLLERVKFLSIFSSNLDEFFMKRVGGLKQQIAAGIVHQTPDGMTAAQELSAVRDTVTQLLKQQAEVYENVLKPQLRENSISLLAWDELNQPEKEFAQNFFRTQVFPILTPLSVDPGHPFPYLSNLSTSLGITLRHPEQPDEKLFARVKVPELLPPWIKLELDKNSTELRMLKLRDVIWHNLADLFPGMVVESVMPFRITRNAEVELDELDAEDLLELIEEELRSRRFARTVRLEHGPNPDPWILQLLTEELDLAKEDIYELPVKLDYSVLKQVCELNIPKLKNEVWVPVPSPMLSDEESNIFSVIRQRDFLVHHPYESFSSSVERLARSAADDPRVVAIKVTLYRTGENSSIVPILLRAVEAGKQVVCVIELKAHFDEARNIRWAQAMENAGVHVIYGLVGLKTHAKTMLIVRQEAEGIRCYAHIGTGNYHSQTANLYTDLGLLTCDPEITSELVELFHFLTGRSLKRDYKALLVAPFNMKARFMQLIEREAEFAKAGKPARILAKMNSLEDHDISRALYKASQAGVEIDLIVRGLCCLRPGVKGLSEKIRVISIVGRLLEHSRVFIFQAGANDILDGEFYIGSADWMYRNLLNRVEVIAPIRDKQLREKLWESFKIMLADERQAWQMQPDGKYTRKVSANGSGAAQLGTHSALMKLSRDRANQYSETRDAELDQVFLQKEFSLSGN